MFNDFTDEQIMLRNMIGQFADKEVAPLAYEIDRDERFPSETFKKMSKLGLMGLTVPKEYGGSGGGTTETCIVSEELGRVCMATTISWNAHTDLCCSNLNRNGTDEQKGKYLIGLGAGEKMGALAMTEPNAGSDVISMQTKAVRKGDFYILNGTKTFITNGPIADVIIIYAKTDPQKRSRGISAFIVERDFPGFVRGKEFKKMGWRGSPTGELIMEDCQVPASNLLGIENEGIKILMGGLNTERIVVAATCLGLSRGACEAAVKYARERVQFGKPIGQFQMIQERLANMAVNIEASELLVYQCAKMADAGKAQSMNKEAACAKLFASETCMWIATEAVQIFGGYGYIREFPVERYMRDAKMHTIGAGSSQIMCRIIAKEMMK